MSARDWKRCSPCSGLGFRGDRRCNLCWELGGHMWARRITEEGSVEIAYWQILLQKSPKRKAALGAELQA